MPPSHSKVGQLFVRVTGQYHVVHQYQNVSFVTVFFQLFLLHEQLFYELFVPRREEEAVVPVLLHHGLEHGVTGGRTDEGDDQVKFFVHAH